MTSRALSNAAVLAALKIASPLLSWLVVLSVSRKLGAAGLGRYSLAYAFLALFSLPGPLGLPALLTREGARDAGALGRLLSCGMALGGTVSLMLAIAMASSGFLLRYDPATARALVVLSAAVPLSAWLACFDAAFLALQDAAPIAVAVLAEHAVKVGLAIPALLAGYGLDAVLAAAAAGRFASCAVCVLLLRRRNIRLAPPAGLAPVLALARRTPVFALTSICAALYWRADVFLLSRLRGVAETGYYTSAYRILDLTTLLPQSICQALYPQMAERRTARPFRRSKPLAALILLTAPIPLAVAVFARPLLGGLYGPGFTIMAPVLTILIWTAVPYAWNRYHACVLVAAGRQRADLAINAAMLALNVALNLLIIPRHGAAGAAIATLLTALAFGAAQFFCLKRQDCARVTAGHLHRRLSQNPAGTVGAPYRLIPLFLFAAFSNAQDRPTIGAAVSAADFQYGIAYEGLATIFGSHLSDQTYTASVPLPARLGPTEVRYCPQLSTSWDQCVPMELLFVSPAQINFRVPYRFGNQTLYGALVVRRDDILSDETRRQAIGPVAPRIFQVGFDCAYDALRGSPSPCGLAPQRISSQQVVRGAITGEDGALVTSGNPARIGSFYTVWLTGLGHIDNGKTPFDLQITAAGIPASGSAAAVSTPVKISFAGYSPQFPGLYQINFRLPDGLPCGEHKLELTLHISEGQSEANPVQLPVLIRSGDSPCVR
jgi:uncharacterized protein (TIGR03437 family)